MVKSLPLRSEVNSQETWNLDNLFATEEDFTRAVSDFRKQVDLFHSSYKGKLKDSTSVVAALKEYLILKEKMVQLNAYTSLSLNSDQTDDDAQMRASMFSATSAKTKSTLSFLYSELLELPNITLEQSMLKEVQFKDFLEKLIKMKEHQLHPMVEKTLAAYSSTFDAPYNLYNTTKMVDMTFEDFVVNGKSYPMSYVSFEGDWESETDTEIRRAAFHSFSNKLKEYQHTAAKTYDIHLQTEKITCDLRGHDTIFDFLLFDQEVERSMYDRQIDLIMSELAPHMRRYAKLLQKVHGLDKMTFADLKVPLDPAYEPQISIEESKKIIDRSLSVLGDDYLNMIHRSYTERWIDFAQNKGKSTGAFCLSPYGKHSFIHISWTGSMSDLFLLAHELGHAGHFYNSQREQNILNAAPSLYFIEAPSTMNEMLVATHLLENLDNNKFKRYVISSIISRTYYHNFVTHLLEAAFQRQVYEHVENGLSVNARILNELKRGVLEEFWGKEIEINDGAELTWMRQPHYYMGLYPYTYSAGLTISTQVSKRIQSKGQSAVDDWLEVLKAGGTKSSIELAKMAGIDITTEQPLRDTITYIGELIDQLEELTAKIGAE